MAKRRPPVVDRHRGTGFRRAGHSRGAGAARAGSGQGRRGRRGRVHHDGQHRAGGTGVAGAVRRLGSQRMAAIGQRGDRERVRPHPVRGRLAKCGAPAVGRHRRVGLGRAGERRGVVVRRRRAGKRRGARGARVDDEGETVAGSAAVPGTVRSGGRNRVRAIGEYRARGEAVIPAPVRRRLAKRGAIRKDGHRRGGLRRAAEGGRGVVGRVGRGEAGNAWRGGVDEQREGAAGGADVARAVRGGGGDRVGAVGQGRARGETVVAVPVRARLAKRGAGTVNGHGGIRLGRAGPCRRVVAGGGAPGQRWGAGRGEVGHGDGQGRRPGVGAVRCGKREGVRTGIVEQRTGSRHRAGGGVYREETAAVAGRDGVDQRGVGIRVGGGGREQLRAGRVGVIHGGRVAGLREGRRVVVGVGHRHREIRAGRGRAGVRHGHR